jgi:hypothetical protein
MTPRKIIKLFRNFKRYFQGAKSNQGFEGDEGMLSNFHSSSPLGNTFKLDRKN